MRRMTLAVTTSLLLSGGSPAVSASGDRVHVHLGNGGYLEVVGTPVDERMTVSTARGKVWVKVGGKFYGVSLDDVRKVGLSGARGDDVVRATGDTASLRQVLLSGGPGDDRLIDSRGGHALRGGPGDDVLVPGGGNDELRGQAGDDRYRVDGDLKGTVRVAEFAAGGVDTLDMSSTSGPVRMSTNGTGSPSGYGDVFMTGGDPFENLIGGPGDDELVGNEGLVAGGDGDDDIVFDRGLASAGRGDDTIQFLPENQGPGTVVDGGGYDTIALSGPPGATISLATTAPQAVSATYVLTIPELHSFEALLGAFGADQLTGDGRANRLDGSGGDDVIDGGAGDDVLQGGRGRFDLAYEDMLTGGPGTDVFEVGGVPTDGGAQWWLSDVTITDFTPGEHVALRGGTVLVSGLGTSTVTVEDSSRSVTVTATNGHLWQVGDFT